MTTVSQIRAGCYLRISSDPKDKREGVDRQREDTVILCETKGWTPVDFYVDNDRSASNGKDRPEWDRLLADIEAGKVDAIAAWDQDRGWRVMGELEQLRKFFKSLGHPVLFATTGQGDIDLFSPTGVMMAQIKTAVSEHEIAMMKVRQKRAGRQKAERGLPKWRRAFGFLGETYQPDPVTAPLVKKAYETIIAGASLGDVARMFNDAEAFGLHGRPWTQSTISLFLRDPRNAALRDYEGEILKDADGNPVKGAWAELVDEQTWRAAQSVLTAPGRAPGRKSVRRHLLTGILVCGKCEGTLSGGHTSTKKIVYGCKTDGCRGVSIRAADVEDQIYGLLGDRLAQEDARDLLLKQDHDAADVEEINKQLAVLHAKKLGYVQQHHLGEIDDDEFREYSRLVKEGIAKLTRRLEDEDRRRVFDDLDLGTPNARKQIRMVSPDRLRAILTALGTITIKPVGKGGTVWDEKAKRKIADPNRVLLGGGWVETRRNEHGVK